MSELKRIQVYENQIDQNLQIAAVMKNLDGGKAILFPSVNGSSVPVIGNLLCCRENCEAAFGTSFKDIRRLVDRAFNNPLEPTLVTDPPVQACVHTKNFDVRELMPILKHTAEDAGQYISAGIVIVKDLETNIYNASYHRLKVNSANRLGIKLDYGRHLRLAHERAKARKEALPIAICLGADLALQYTAATMGSRMPEHADELKCAGGLAGRPLPVANAITQPIIIPAEAEIIIEGKILPDDMEPEGPFGEFIGYLAPMADAPIVEISAITHRTNPIYQAINGYGRETIMLRKYVLEATLLNILQAATPIVLDAEMTAGGLHRFHAVIQVKKTTPQHNGMQRNVIAAAFGALKDLDLVTVVDEDINIRDPLDVEYALATRFEASKDLVLIPGARGHEYVRASADGIRSKLGIDASVPFEDKALFARCEFEKVSLEEGSLKDTSENYDSLWNN
jgi:2,5-furandicarboxylate decarboxylase 1